MVRTCYSAFFLVKCKHAMQSFVDKCLVGLVCAIRGLHAMQIFCPPVGNQNPLRGIHIFIPLMQNHNPLYQIKLVSFLSFSQGKCVAPDNSIVGHVKD